MKVIGIAGGSGSGKSTVSYALVDSNPTRFGVINLDDYQKRKDDTDLPRVDNIINYDHPNITRWADLLADIEKLHDNKAVTIDVWSHRSNPDFRTHRQTIARTIQPKPILIIEGYLALYRSEIYSQCARTYYLDADDQTRAARRRSVRGGKNNIIGVPDYESKILMPMHKQFVEPTKHLADVIIDVSIQSVPEVLARIRRDISTFV